MASPVGKYLNRLRALMKNKQYVKEGIQAYIIPTDDRHQSEYIAECDQRRAFITGFTGSAGTAVVTETMGALWTDGRYFAQAESQLDPQHWTLMRSGLPNVPTQAQWLNKVLQPGSRIGTDAHLISASSWQPMQKTLAQKGHTLVHIDENLIDLVWEDQPPPPNNPVTIHPTSLAGESWQEKMVTLRQKMATKEATALVITALDEVAWMLNLRGSDIDFNPCFMSYVIVTKHQVKLFVDSAKLDKEIVRHLGDAIILPYSDVQKNIEKILEEEPEARIWISEKSSYALYNTIPEKQRLSLWSPVAEMKAVKNAAEIQGMKNAHIKDAVALCEYFAWLEKEVPTGTVTEVSGLDQLSEFRQQQEGFVSPSFYTISSIGSDGAIIHYRATKETDKVITTEHVYLCDSGAQFKDGTTDVTRTMHFGTPTKYQQECFTRVLKGHIKLATSVFPNGVKGHMLDSFARSALWEVGLDYMHGTGHGVGSFLNVHEGPCSISYRPKPDEVDLQAGMILSNEPGYYEDGEFGIRIESLVVVKKADTRYNFKKKGFLTFESITLVPIQMKMILPELLTDAEMEWLNQYHQTCRDVIGPVLQEQNRPGALKWLMKETQPIG